MANHVVIRPFAVADHLTAVLDAAYAAGFEVVAPDPLGAGSGWLLARRRTSDVVEADRIRQEVDSTVRLLEAQLVDLDTKVAEERLAALAAGACEYAPPASEWGLAEMETVSSEYWDRYVVGRQPLPTDAERELRTERSHAKELCEGWQAVLAELERFAKLA